MRSLLRTAVLVGAVMLSALTSGTQASSVPLKSGYSDMTYPDNLGVRLDWSVFAPGSFSTPADFVAVSGSIRPQDYLYEYQLHVILDDLGEDHPIYQFDIAFHQSPGVGRYPVLGGFGYAHDGINTDPTGISEQVYNHAVDFSIEVDYSNPHSAILWISSPDGPGTSTFLIKDGTTVTHDGLAGPLAVPLPAAAPVIALGLALLALPRAWRRLRRHPV